jgi:hypothetical protein
MNKLPNEIRGEIQRILYDLIESEIMSNELTRDFIVGGFKGLANMTDKEIEKEFYNWTEENVTIHITYNSEPLCRLINSKNYNYGNFYIDINEANKNTQCVCSRCNSIFKHWKQK